MEAGGGFKVTIGLTKIVFAIILVAGEKNETII